MLQGMSFERTYLRTVYKGTVQIQKIIYNKEKKDELGWGAWQTMTTHYFNTPCALSDTFGP